MTADHIKPIETRYAGCRFRSRLEARWAVFFDHCGLEWHYEPEGFVGCYGMPYLPDFFLPGLLSPTRTPGMFVEVKGTDESLRADGPKIGQCIDYGSTRLSTGLIILGPVPQVVDRWGTLVTHDALSWRKGVDLGGFYFDNMRTNGGVDYPATVCYTWPGPWSHQGNTTEDVPDDTSVEARVWSISCKQGNDSLAHSMSQVVFDAYRAARSARFEHGESGATWKPPVITSRQTIGGRARRDTMP